MSRDNSLQGHLDALKRADPAVALAAANYDAMQQRILAKRTAAAVEDDPEKIAAFREQFAGARSYVLVDRSDPATVESAARAAHDALCNFPGEDLAVCDRDFHSVATAVLASLTGTGDNKEQEK
jgi:hypothetical protein